MLAAGAALQLQLFTIGTCLHRQELVTQVWIATRACCYLSDVRLQPNRRGGRGVEGGWEVGRVFGGWGWRGAMHERAQTGNCQQKVQA